MLIQYNFGGLIILLSLIIFGSGIYFIYTGDLCGIMPVLVGIIFTVTGILIITDDAVPTKQDVLDGEAIYQENIHIRANDTIKTYDIIWKQKN